MGTEVESVRTLAGTNGAALHIAAVKGGGFVVLGSDTEDVPVVAVSADGSGEPDERNPLWILLRRDMAARLQARTVKRRTLKASGAAKTKAAPTPQERWAMLLDGDAADDSSPARRKVLSAGNGRAAIADVRVDALVKSAWSQEDYRNYGYRTDDDICYNYYTPNHWPCGCVATAGAQIMRYHSHPTGSVVAKTYACRIDGSPAELKMYGGTYDWSAMTLVPANGCSAKSREAIGKLTYDVGVSVGMSYRSGGASAADYMLKKRFVDRFQYANAACVTFWDGFAGGGYYYSLDHLKEAVIPSLDAGLPVVLGLGGDGGHAVVGDGYGYSGGDFFMHINVGWSNLNDGNAWYAPCDVETGDYHYTAIESVVYNIYPTGAPGLSIVSGRVLSAGGLPVAGATIRAEGGGSPAETTSNAKGVYALRVLPGEWRIVAEKDGLNGDRSVTVAGCVSPNIDESGSYWSDVRPQIGNVCDTDLTLDVADPPAPPEPPEPENLTWHTTRKSAFDAAADSGKRILLVFGRDTCGNTTATRNGTCEDATVKAKLLADYVLWYSNCDTQSAESGRYLMNFGGTLPGVSVIDPASDKAIAGAGGYQDVPAMMALLKAAEDYVPPAPERTLPEARIEAFEAGKILFVLSGADWCPYTLIVKDYIQSLGSTFTDDFVLYYCNVDTDTTGMADGIPSYGAFDPVEFAGNWSDGLLAYNSGGVEDRVQKVLDDALAAYAQRTPPVETYLITYDLQGGTLEADAPKTYAETDLPLALPTPSKDGHVFEGWMLDDHVIDALPAGTKGHVQPTATWRPLTADDYTWTYTITDGKATIGGPEDDWELYWTAAVSPRPLEDADIEVPSTLGGCPVVAIGHEAFIGLRFRSIRIPATVTDCGRFDQAYIGEYVVDAANPNYRSENGNLYSKDRTLLVKCGCKADELLIPDGVVELGEGACRGCNATKVVLPASVRTLGYGAFEASRIARVDMPEGLQEIGEYAFWECDSLDGVEIPASVTRIGDAAFSLCDSLVSLTVSPGNPNYCMIGGALYAKDGSELLRCSPTSSSCVVPESVRRVGNSCFAPVNWEWSQKDLVLADIYFRGNAPEGSPFYCAPEGLTCHVREGSAGWAGPASTALPETWPTDNGRRIVRWEGEPPMTYTVTFDLGEFGVRTGGGELEQTVIGGAAADVPTVSAAAGYEFAGWDPVPDCVTADMTSRAFYKRAGALEPGHYAVETNGYTWSFTVADGGVTIESGDGEWQRALEPAPVGTVEIPSELGGWPVTSIGYCAFVYCGQMTAVTIPSSVTNITSYAFAYCGGLRSVTIPSGVAEIGCAFYGCDALRALAFNGNEPRYLGYGTACAPMSAAVLVREESEGWRDGDDLIATWPRDVEAPCPVRLWSGTMAEYAIAYELGRGGENAADNPDFYIDALLPQKLSAPTCEGHAFKGWMLDGHEVAEIPVGTTGDIVLTALWEEVPAEPGWGWSDGVRQWRYVTVEYNDSGTTKTGAKISNEGMCAVSPRPQGALTVPSEIDGHAVVEVDDFAFADCPGLTSVTLPPCFIGDYLTARAFAGCDDLTSVSVASGGSTGLYNVRNGLLLYRDDWLVLCPPGLSNPVIPETVQSLERAAFYENRKMTRIVIPDGIGTVSGECFMGCENLSEIVCPPTLTSFSGNPFKGTAWETAQGDFVVMNSVLLDYRGADGDLAVPEGVRVINAEALCWRSDVVSVDVPSSVEQIGDYAFYYCSSLARITGGAGLARVGQGVMRGTAFWNEAPNGLLTVCGWVVGYKGEVPEELVIPAEVRGIADSAFSGCESLKTVTYLGDPSGVIIGRGAFEDTPYEAAKCPFLDSPIEAKSQAQSSGKLLFVLSGADWCPWTTVVKRYLRSLGDSFFDRFVVYYCNVDTDTHNMADGVPSYGVFDPAKFRVNWRDGRLAYDSGGVEERVQKVIDDALAAYDEPPVVNYYTVRFDANGGGGTMADQSFACGQPQALSRNAFFRENRAFSGWALSAGGEVVHANGAVVSDLTAEPNGVVTLYAVWVENAAGRLYDDADKFVSGGDDPPYASAAAVYDGYLYEGESVVGSLQVKIAKGKVDKKTGVFSAKVTATVQLAGETKKLSFKNGIADATGLVTAMMDKNGNELAVSVGVNGLGGMFRRAGDNATCLIDGARNVFSGKSIADKLAAAMALRLYQGTYNIVLDGGTLSVAVDKKGKAKISGTVDGAAVSATSQLLVGDGVAAIPVVIVKKVNIAFCLWLTVDGAVEVKGTTGIAGKPERIEDDATFNLDADAFAELLGGLYADFLPNGLPVDDDGKKWVVAKGAKAGKLVLLDKATGELDLAKSKLTDNTSGLKLAYKAKDGTFTGSFKVYAFEKNKIKSYTAKVTGVLVNGRGYGYATISKVGSAKVWID